QFPETGPIAGCSAGAHHPYEAGRRMHLFGDAFASLEVAEGHARVCSVYARSPALARFREYAAILAGARKDLAGFTIHDVGVGASADANRTRVAERLATLEIWRASAPSDLDDLSERV